ncbi:MAG: alpha/beta hydrolase [Alphaproteobacteria bacterium]|nr:alpha/beta hydrolase [Alphaproteobacteria bacterium]
MDNPLVTLPERVPAALPAIRRINALRRRVEGRLRSFDVMDWPGVRYGPGERQVMRLWELNDLAPRDGWPGVLLIHGGGWVEGDLSDFESLAPAFARRGIVAAAMNYRLAPDDRWPAPLDDAEAALERLRDAQTDPQRLAVWGHSAGGHIALQLARRRPDLVACVVAMGAPTDLRQLATHGVDDLGRVFDDDQLEPASPISATDPPVPTLLVHGDADAVVPVGHARAFATSWPDQTELIEIPDGDHGIRWPPFSALRARRRAVDWVQTQLAPANRGSKWKRKGREKR